MESQLNDHNRQKFVEDLDTVILEVSLLFCDYKYGRYPLGWHNIYFFSVRLESKSGALITVDGIYFYAFGCNDFSFE